MTISLPRGDIRNVRFQINDGSQVYTDFDEIYFTVKKDYKKEDYLIQKKLSAKSITLDKESGFFSFRLEPEDTNELNYGTYVFDIEINKGDVIKQTSLGQLIITEEVTFSANENEDSNP